MRLVLCALALATSACMRAPDSYPLPAQYAMPSGPEPPTLLPDPVRPLLAMADPDWKAHTLADVMDGPDAEWRWTNQHPRFRLTLREVRGLRFYLRCIVAEETFRQVGLPTLSISINGHALDRVRLANQGENECIRPVPAGWLVAGEPVLIAVDIDPVLAEPGGVKLGVLLHSIGFRK